MVESAAFMKLSRSMDNTLHYRRISFSLFSFKRITPCLTPRSQPWTHFWEYFSTLLRKMWVIQWENDEITNGERERVNVCDD